MSLKKDGWEQNILPPGCTSLLEKSLFSEDFSAAVDCDAAGRELITLLT